MLRMRLTRRHGSAPDADQVFGKLQRRLPGLLPHESRQTPLRQLPMDSLDLVELLCVFEDEFGVRLSTDDFRRVETVGELTDLIVAACAEKEARS